MKKVCIVTYYELKEVLLLCAESLRALGYTVINFPLFQYCHDVYDQREDYIEMFHSFLQKEAPDVILWWCHSVKSIEDFDVLINNHLDKMMILYNWDDPHCWKVKENFMQEKTKYLDVALSCCMGAKPLYLEAGCKKFEHVPPGFDPTIHKYIYDPDFECDVSMCITNVYSKDIYPDQYIERKSILDALEKETDIKFHLYGPEFLKELYPRSYRRPLHYTETPKLFSNSKINISTHVIYDQDMYINERCNLILACKGLLLVDPVKGIEKIYDIDKHIVLLEKDYIPQIKHILANYSEYAPRKEQGYQFVLEHYTWDSWGLKVHKEIGLHFFDENNSFGISKDEFEKACAEKKIVFPYVFNVPQSFEKDEYYNRTKAALQKAGITEFESNEKAFVHWKTIGQFSRFKSGHVIKNTNTGGNIIPNAQAIYIDRDPIPYCSISQEYKLNSILFELKRPVADPTRKNELFLENLKRLDTFFTQNPMIDASIVADRFVKATRYPEMDE